MQVFFIRPFLTTYLYLIVGSLINNKTITFNSDSLNLIFLKNDIAFLLSSIYPIFTDYTTLNHLLYFIVYSVFFTYK